MCHWVRAGGGSRYTNSAIADAMVDSFIARGEGFMPNRASEVGQLSSETWIPMKLLTVTMPDLPRTPPNPRARPEPRRSVTNTHEDHAGLWREQPVGRRTRYEARARATARTRGGGAGRASRRVLHGAGPACYATRRVIVTRRRVMQHATPFPMWCGAVGQGSTSSAFRSI